MTYLFNKQLLNTCYFSDSVLGTGEKVVDGAIVPTLIELIFEWVETDNRLNNCYKWVYNTMTNYNKHWEKNKTFQRTE